MKILKTLFVGSVGILSAIYLLNPTFGIDFLPDTLPIVGNLDEVAFTMLFLASLSYFGVSPRFLRFFSKGQDVDFFKKKKEKNITPRE